MFELFSLCKLTNSNYTDCSNRFNLRRLLFVVVNNQITVKLSVLIVYIEIHNTQSYQSETLND